MTGAVGEPEYDFRTKNLHALIGCYMKRKVPSISLSRFYQLKAPTSEHDYIIGLRGFFTIESFIWIFLQTFIPASVKDTNNTSGSRYQLILRNVLSVIFWNETLLYSFFITLSARTICIPFLKDPTKANLVGAIFRRGLRLWFPVATALAIVKAIFSWIGFAYIETFKDYIGNDSIDTPYEIPNALVYFNSVFNLFWTTNNFSHQGGSNAFPSQTLWVVNVIYSQSYTVYMAMVIIPYTRARWRVQAAVCFIVTAWWVQSWAWYSITGLILADAVVNMDFKNISARGIRVWRSRRCPSKVIYLFLMISGIVVQYLWTNWRPQYENYELQGHTGLYYTGGLNTAKVTVNQPQARDDNYLIVLGALLMLESLDLLQNLFRNRVLLYLGRRSLSASPYQKTYTALEQEFTTCVGLFLVQSTIVYTMGIKLFLYLNQDKTILFPGAVSICLAVCVVASGVAAEVFYRLVDYPSRILAHVLFDWIRR